MVFAASSVLILIHNYCSLIVQERECFGAVIVKDGVAKSQDVEDSCDTHLILPNLDLKGSLRGVQLCMLAAS